MSDSAADFYRATWDRLVALHRAPLCPVCNGRQWASPTALLVHSETMASETPPPRPLVMVRCVACGYVLLFDALTFGSGKV